ncbi:MAG: hypothetical protein ACO3JL_01985 [Myxococcota bacterium]
MKSRTYSTAALLSLLAGAIPAEAQDVNVQISPELTEPPMLEKEEPNGDALFTEFGTALYVGGGVTGFFEEGVTDNTTPGGFWDVRGVAGTRTPVGLELGYHGSAQDVNALGLNDDAFLLSNGLEASLRLQAPITQADINTDVLGTSDAPLLIAPYAFGGLGWTRYDVLNEGTNTSNVQGQDDIMALPLGVGVGLGLAGVTLDARFTYRHAFFSDLVGTATSSFDDVSLNQWNVGASIGFEF